MTIRLMLPLVILAAVCNPAIAASRPNVILVLTDDQGYGDFSCHGNPVLKTPNLDKLHDESIRLTDFHVTPMCTPTRAQLMTGRDALASGAYCVCSGRTFLRRDLPTMAGLFAAAGYRTALFGKWHLGDNYPHRPMDRGFHHALYHLSWGITSAPDYWNNDYFDDWFRCDGKLRRYKGYCTDVWFDEAMAWMKTCQKRGQPFLTYLALNAPHGPFWAPAKYRALYPQLDRDTAGFFAMIANMDDNMARLDAMLRETGLRDNTILIFMTDNGGTGGIKVFNGNLRGAKTSHYEGGHRVPCFIRWPAGGLRPTGDVDALTQNQDILPTLLDLCGVAPPAGTRFDGTSLAPLLRGRAQPELAERILVVQYGGLEQSEPAKWDCAVMWKKWRLVKGGELYDLTSDPSQRQDVAGRHPAVGRKLREHYEKWWAGVQPALADTGCITVGSPRENPTCLSSVDWFSPKLTAAAQTIDIRLLGEMTGPEGALPMGRPPPALNGPWHIHIERDGIYEIALRRWPKEADAAITAGLPAFKAADGEFPAGKALPVAKARVKVADADVSKPVAPKDKAATFVLPLRSGRTQLQTWFYDADGKELCGAFYVDVRRR
ncbi:MAG: arylsulfatase [Verrucomicrobiae bacterium]|nr:arylsulfatase [Verrucomicrobiae bacterium]